MKKIIVLFLIVCFASIGTSSITYAEGGCPISGGGAAGEGGGVVNNVCPVMGGAVSKDTSSWVVHNGKKIGFCCAGCIGAFKANPDKYLPNLIEE